MFPDAVSAICLKETRAWWWKIVASKKEQLIFKIRSPMHQNLFAKHKATHSLPKLKSIHIHGVASSDAYQCKQEAHLAKQKPHPQKDN